jgi:hypothetical protein
MLTLLFSFCFMLVIFPFLQELGKPCTGGAGGQI